MTTTTSRAALLVALLTLLGGCMAAEDKGPLPDVTAGKADGTLEIVEHDDFAFDQALNAELSEGVGHAWTLTLAEPARVTFTTSGGEYSVDTVVFLHADGMEIGSDDDGGEGYYSRLEADLAPGTYKVTVAGYGDAAGPFTLTATSSGGAPVEPSEDPWAGARDVHLANVPFTEATPIPESYARPEGVSPISLSSPEWWQRWSGGATQSFTWSEGTDYGKRCGQASAIRLQAIVEYEEVLEDGTVTHPGKEAFDRLLEGSGWRGTMYNWTEDVSQGGYGSFRTASMWAWRTSAVKFINVVRPDGSCDLPTLDLVQRFSATCLAQAGDGTEIQGCRASN